MEKVVSILPEESDAVQVLFIEYNTYIELLGLLSEKNIDKEIFNEQFEKAKNCNLKLSLLKDAMQHKYQPKGEDFERYEFDFRNHTMVFKK